jgi:hypothetical protein
LSFSARAFFAVVDGCRADDGGAEEQEEEEEEEEDLLIGVTENPLPKTGAVREVWAA